VPTVSTAGGLSIQGGRFSEQLGNLFRLLSHHDHVIGVELDHRGLLVIHDDSAHETRIDEGERPIGPRQLDQVHLNPPLQPAGEAFGQRGRRSFPPAGGALSGARFQGRDYRIQLHGNDAELDHDDDQQQRQDDDVEVH